MREGIGESVVNIFKEKIDKPPDTYIEGTDGKEVEKEIARGAFGGCCFHIE
jgi:hypothetical protein